MIVIFCFYQLTAHNTIAPCCFGHGLCPQQSLDNMAAINKNQGGGSKA